jgi:hypothetical protein
MGAGIVSRLSVAGHTRTGWNRTREKAEAIISEGMKWKNSPLGIEFIERLTRDASLCAQKIPRFSLVIFYFNISVL